MAKRTWLNAPIPFILLCIAVTAQARQTEPGCEEDGSATSACSESRIEHVLVTATRRESPLKKVPVSVTVLSGEQLDAMGAAVFEDYARSVPGLSFTDVGLGGGKKHVIRGVTTGVFGESRAATAIYLDDTPITDASFGSLSSSPHPLLEDISRIEVLRGPQGTLFGSGSMGGGIRIITNEPDLDSFGGYVRTNLTSTKHGSLGYDLRAVLNAPLAGGNSAIRAVAYRRDLDGWIDNTLLGEKQVNNNETNGLRLAATWSSHDRLTINGKVIRQNRQSDGSMVDQGNPPWAQQRAVKEPSEDEWTLVNLKIDYQFDRARLISSTSWMDRAVDINADLSTYYNTLVYPQLPNFIPGFNPHLFTTVTTVDQHDQEEFIQEFRLISTGDQSLQWLLGLFYQDQDYHLTHEELAPGFDAQTGGSAAFLGAPDKLLVVNTDRPLQQTAVFGDITRRFGPKWELSLGGRWFKFDYAQDSLAYGFLNRGQTFDRSSTDETGFTPKLSLSYFSSEDITLYGSVSSGYRPGGNNETVAEDFTDCREELNRYGLIGIPQSFESDSLWSYELGLKSNWADQRIFLNAAAFYIDWTDIQTQVILECRAGWRENVGAATSKGFEFELAAYPAQNLELALNGAITDATLSEDVFNLGGTKGEELPGVPEFAFGGSVTWLFGSFAGFEGSVRADYQYVDSSFNSFSFYGRQETPSHSLTNLRVSFHKNRWETSLFINNLFDNRAIVTVNNNYGGQYVTTARPFTVGVSARFGF